MTEDELQQHRRERLRAWIDDHGGLAKVGERRKLKPSYQSYLSQITNGYSIGSRGARTCETRLGMPGGWLDEVTPTSPTAELLSDPAEANSLEAAVSTIADSLQSLPPERRAEVVRIFSLLTDFPDEPDYSARLVKLLRTDAGRVHESGKHRRAA